MYSFLEWLKVSEIFMVIEFIVMLYVERVLEGNYWEECFMVWK